MRVDREKICHCCCCCCPRSFCTRFHVLNFYYNDKQLWVNGIADTLNKVNWKLHFMAIKCAVQMLACFIFLSFIFFPCFLHRKSQFIWGNFKSFTNLIKRLISFIKLVALAFLFSLSPLIDNCSTSDAVHQIKLKFCLKET